MKMLTRYLQDVKSELAKVTWPQKSEIVKLTIMVSLISIIVGLYLSGLDSFFTKLLELVVAK
jgi:preprotein translocase SecE subunit